MKARIAIIAALAMLAGVAIAGQVYDRATATVPTAGTVIWTNNSDYAAIELKRIWLENASATNQSVAVTRISADNAYTQTVGTVAIAAATSGSTASFTAAYLANGDKLRFVSTGGIAATGGVAMIDFINQKH
jgi:hypothetical protein